MEQRVTFLMPAYNALPFIKYAVESIVKQTIPDFIVIIINDGSTDGTGDYLDSIEDSRFQIIHQENTGYITALNRGAALVETEYIARLDADDIAAPDRLEKQIAFLDAHPDVAAVGSRNGYIFLKNRRVSINLGFTKIRPEFSPPMANPPMWDPILDKQTITHSSATIRRTAFEAVGGYKDLAPAEDIDLWIRLKENGHNLACLPDTLCLYRIGANSQSSQNFARQQLIGNYAHYAYEKRKSGEPADSLEDYAKSLSITEKEMLEEALKIRLRNSMGKLLAGNFIQGTAGVLNVFLKNPKHLLDKIRARC